MPIRVACGCGKQLQVPDAAAGKRVRCPACQAVVPVPGAPAPAAAPPAESTDSPPASRAAFGAAKEAKGAEPQPPKSQPAKKPQKEQEPQKEQKPAMSLDDDEPEPPAPKSAKKARSLDDEEKDADDEAKDDATERPVRKKRRREADEDGDRPVRKKRPLWMKLLALGCGGMLLLSCAGASLLGGFLYYLSSQEDKVKGKWVVDESDPSSAKLPPLNRAMQFEFESKDKRCTMRLLGVTFSGKWHVVRNRDNDAILVIVDFEEAIGPDGKKATATGKDKFQAAFEITPVDATHIDLVDVKERNVKMRLKKVDAFDKAPDKAEAPTPDTPTAKRPDDPPAKKPEAPAGPKYPLVLRGHNGPINGVAFTADGSAVVTASEDGKVRVYDPVTGQLRSTLSGHAAAVTGVVALPEGGFVTTGGSSTKEVGEVFEWELSGAAPKRKLFTSKNKVSAVALSADGKTLAWDDYVNVALWDREAGEVRTKLPGISNPKSLAFSKDGKRVAGVDSTSLVVWDAETAKPLPKLPLQRVNCAAFLPTGELVVCTATKNTHVCNVETGKPGPDIQRGRGQPVEAVAVSPDGRFLAQGAGQSVAVYDLVAKDFVTSWLPNDAGIPRHVPVRVAFSPDGTKLVTGTSEVTNCFAVVWDLGLALAKAKK